MAQHESADDVGDILACDLELKKVHVALHGHVPLDLDLALDRPH